MNDLDSFTKNGWCIIESGIPSNVLTSAANYTLSHSDDDPRVTNAFASSSDIKNIACCSNVTNFIDNVYGKSCFPFQTLNFSHGSQQALHQDTIHFQSYPSGYMCAAWVALEDISINSGPLTIVDNSGLIPTFQMAELSKLPAFSRSDRSINYSYYEEQMKDLTESLQLKTRTILLKKGQALIWDSRLIHGGSAILDPNITRLSQVTHYFFEDCLYYSPLQSDVFNGYLRYTLPYNVRLGKRISPKTLFASARKLNISIIYLFLSFVLSFFKR